MQVTVIDHRCKNFFEYTAVGDKVNIEYENGTIIKGEVYDATETILKVKTQMFMRTIYLSDLQHQGFLIKVLHEVDIVDTADEKPLEVVYVSGKTTVLPGGGKTVVEPIKTLPEGSARTNEGRKYDSGKPMYNLLPADALEEVVKVLTYGALKYNEPIDQENWRLVQNPEQRYFAACQRHLWAIRRGELNDPESGILHYAHAITSLMFLLQLELEKNKTAV